MRTRNDNVVHRQDPCYVDTIDVAAVFIIILLSYSFMALSGFLFIYIIIAINYWIRDVIREYTKKYEVLIIMLFIVFLVFVFSEGLLFLSFFWVFFHSSCSSAAEDPLGIYVPDPCELTYTNTLLLSNAALSLGCTFICREAVINGHISNQISFTIISMS